MDRPGPPRCTNQSQSFRVALKRGGGRREEERKEDEIREQRVGQEASGGETYNLCDHRCNRI